MLKKLLKVVISIILTMSMSTTTVFAEESEVDSNTYDGTVNGRISAFIDMAKNKTISSASFTSSSLTESDIQFLGVYISNFYIPFSTELGESAGEDSTAVNVEDITKALQTNLNFDDSMAQAMAENLVGLSASNNEELKLAVSKEWQKDLQVLDKNFNMNYYTLLSMMCGSLDQIAYQMIGDGGTTGVDTDTIKTELDSQYDVWKDVANGKYNYAYLVNSSNQPVFDANIADDRTGMTPSQAVFFKCLQTVDYENGVGFSFYDLTSQDIKGVSKDNFSEALEKIKDEEAWQMSIYGQKLKIDCFGNLLITGGNHMYVIIPGCMNPYTWQAVNSQDKPLDAGGMYLNIINIPMMSMQDNGQLFNKGISTTTTGKDETTSKDTSTNGGQVQDMVYEDTLKTKVNITSTAKDYDKLVKKLIIDKLVIATNSTPNNFDVTLSRGSVTNTTITYNVKISGPSSVLKTAYNGNCNSYAYKLLTDKYGSTSNFVKAVKQENGTSKISEIAMSKGAKEAWGRCASKYDEIGNLDNEFDTLFKGVRNKAKSVSKDSNKKNSSGSSTDKNEEATVSVSTGFINMDEEAQMMETLSVDDNGSTWGSKNGKRYGFVLRLFRGNSEVDLGSDSSFAEFFGNGDSEYRNEAIRSQNSFLDTTNKYGQNIYRWNGDGLNKGSQHVDVWSSEGKKSAFENSEALNVHHNMIYIDDMGMFDTGEDYSVFNASPYITENNKSLGLFTATGADGTYGYTNKFKNEDTGHVQISSNMDDTAIASVYLTYLFASSGVNTGELGYRLNENILPEMSNNPLKLSDSAIKDMETEAIRDWLYYLLHPTEGFNYVSTLINNKVNGFLVSWHDNMVGTSGTGALAGTTNYRGFTGYVTVPEMDDIPLVGEALNMYNTLLPFIIVLLLIIVIASAILGILSWQKSIVGFLIFALMAVMLPNMFSGVISISNKFSSVLYGEKFTYWALVQHETYSKQIDEAASGDSYENYLKTLYATNNEAKGNQGSESVMLKWQSPKKMASLMYSEKDEEALNEAASSDMTLITKYISENAYDGQTFLDGTGNNYFYRSYIDISNFSRFIYKGLKEGVKPTYSSITSDVYSNWYDDLQTAYPQISTQYEADRTIGYANTNSGGSKSVNDTLRIDVPLSSKIVSDAYANTDISSLTLGDYVGIDQRAFKFSIPMFTNDTTKYKEYISGSADGKPSDDTKFDSSMYTDEDFSGLAAYGLMSENPYYYFSWDLYDMGLSTETTSNDSYKELLIGSGDSSFFYNTNGNGDMKDFMDLRSLFTYIIPYLAQGNDIVKEWSKVYGLYLYDGVPTEEGLENSSDIKGNPEMEQKYWHNVNVARLYNIYTPWVDLMTSCSYANSEEIEFAGTKYTIEDPLNPESYPDERPMIFSRSEMKDYGLTESQLTEVERRILECNDDMQTRMFNLLNYSNFNDVVMNSAAAMNCAFAFNTAFSEPSNYGTGKIIYPLAFELNNFSYDAYLRLILSTSTGESLTEIYPEGTTLPEQGFYQRIVYNSSMTSSMVLIILDILSMYVIPIMRVLFLFMMFFLAFFTIFICAFRIGQDNRYISRIVNCIIRPLSKFLIISILMSWIVSLFMADGYDGITGPMNVTISLGDPVFVMLVMIIIDVVVAILYFAILRGVFRDLKSSFREVKGFIVDVISSVGVSDSVRSRVKGGNGGTSNSSNSGSTNTSNRSNESRSNRTTNTDATQSEMVKNQEKKSHLKRRAKPVDTESTKEVDSEGKKEDLEGDIKRGRRNINKG